MRAMILSAGRGERMRPLSDTLPKPLLQVKGKALIVWHIENLVRNGFQTVVINIAYLGEKIITALGDGSQWGITIIYSDEREEGALESAGGIQKALKYLGETFLVLNADIFCSYEYDNSFALGTYQAHLILVPNPEHHPKGDFFIEDGVLCTEGESTYTFSGIGYYKATFFEKIELQKAPLAPLLRQAIAKGEISGEVFNNSWHDIGTPKRLEDIQNAT